MATKTEKTQLSIEEAVISILDHWKEGGKHFSLACYEMYTISEQFKKDTKKDKELETAFNVHFHKSYISKMKTIGKFYEKVFSKVDGLPEGMTTLYNVAKFTTDQPINKQKNAIEFVLNKISTKTTSLEIFGEWYEEFTGKKRPQPDSLSGIEGWLVGMKSNIPTVKIEKVAKKINDILIEEGLTPIDLKSVKKKLVTPTKKSQFRGEAAGKTSKEHLDAIKKLA
jgi:hypothetical protein